MLENAGSYLNLLIFILKPALTRFRFSKQVVAWFSGLWGQRQFNFRAFSHLVSRPPFVLPAASWGLKEGPPAALPGPLDGTESSRAMETESASPQAGPLVTVQSALLVPPAGYTRSLSVREENLRSTLESPGARLSSRNIRPRSPSPVGWRGNRRTWLLHCLSSPRTLAHPLPLSPAQFFLKGPLVWPPEFVRRRDGEDEFTP